MAEGAQDRRGLLDGGQARAQCRHVVGAGCPFHLAHPGLGGPAAAVRLTHWTFAAKDTPAWTHVVRADFTPTWRKSEHRQANPLTANFSAAGTLSGQARSYAARRVYR